MSGRAPSGGALSKESIFEARDVGRSVARRQTDSCRNFPFAGSDSGGDRVAAMYSLIPTCKLNDIESRANLYRVLSGISLCNQ